MYGFSNTLIGFLNLFTLLSSIPIIGTGLWMMRSNGSCQSFLQTPLLVLGSLILIISLAGFIGACFHIACALWIYLVIMLLVIISLMGFLVFGFVITSPGGGVDVQGRAYKEYHLEKYSLWLRRRISDPRNWVAIKTCVQSSKICDQIVKWTPYDYLTRNMSPVQSGCCKPPTSCNYGVGVGVGVGAGIQEPDCYLWNNAETVLCYNCNSCKAGLLENVRRDWHKLAVLSIVMVLILIVIYTIGCCAFRNAQRTHAHPAAYAFNPMSKIHPRWDFQWRRWLDDTRRWLY